MQRIVGLAVFAALSLSACDSGPDEPELKGDYESLNSTGLAHFDYVRIDGGTLSETGTLSEILLGTSCVHVRSFTVQRSITDLLRYNDGRTSNVVRFETTRPRVVIYYGENDIVRAVKTDDDLDSILTRPRC